MKEVTTYPTSFIISIMKIILGYNSQLDTQHNKMVLLRLKNLIRVKMVRNMMKSNILSNEFGW